MPSEKPSDPETPQARAERVLNEEGCDSATAVLLAQDVIALSDQIEGKGITSYIQRMNELAKRAERAEAAAKTLIHLQGQAVKRAEEAEAALAEAQSKLKMFQDAARPTIAEVLAPERLAEAEAALSRVRALWPHIEIPDGPLRFLHGKRLLKDPGAPTCLRCKIEEAINA